MYVQALDARTINALANIWTTRYDALVSVTQDNAVTATQDNVVPATQDHVVTAWRELSACHAAACAALERELGERHGLGISDFEVLERLAESGPDGRQGHADHRDVEGIEAQRAAEHDQDGPQLRCPGLAVPVTGIGEKCFG